MPIMPRLAAETPPLTDPLLVPDIFVTGVLQNEWRRKAEAYERAQKAEGTLVIRAVIDPETFSAWCVIRGLNIDAKARTRFANEHVQKIVGGTH